MVAVFSQSSGSHIPTFRAIPTFPISFLVLVLPVKQKQGQSRSTMVRTRKHKTDEPKAKKGRTGKQTWLYCLNTGEEVTIHDYTKAMQFKVNYGALVTGEEHFTTLTAFNARMRANAVEASIESPAKADVYAALAVPGPKTMSPAEKEGLRKMKEIIENNRANNNIECSFYTNGSSARAILFIHHKDQGGKSIWFWKPSHFCLTMSQHAVQFPHPNPIIQHALTSLRTARMRDLAGGPEKQREVLVKKKGSQQPHSYPSQLAWTHFPIPYQEFPDKEAETAWLKEIGKLIGVAIKQIQLTDLYLFALEAAVNSPRMWVSLPCLSPLFYSRPLLANGFVLSLLHL